MPLTVWQLDPAQMTTYYNLALCDALAAQGCQVRYVTSQFLYDDALPEQAAFITDKHYFRLLGWRILLRYPHIRRALRAISYPADHLRLYAAICRHRPDIVHFQWSRLPRLDYPLIKQVQRLGIPVVHTVHDVIPLFSQTAEGDPHRQIYTSVDAVIVHTPDSRDALLRRYSGIDPVRVHIVPHLSIKNHATPADANQTVARQRLNLPPKVPVFLFFGSIKAYKGLEVLNDAWPEVVAHVPDAVLLIAGRPDGPAQAALLDELGQLPGVRVDARFIPYDEVWLYHHAADVVVFPYHRIYQSGALITSLSFGRAVVVTEVGGLPEGVDGNGWIVPPKNADSLGKTMIEAAADRNRLEAMGKRSLTLLEDRFGATIMAEKTLAIYRTLLEASV